MHIHHKVDPIYVALDRTFWDLIICSIFHFMANSVHIQILAASFHEFLTCAASYHKFLTRISCIKCVMYWCIQLEARFISTPKLCVKYSNVQMCGFFIDYYTTDCMKYLTNQISLACNTSATSFSTSQGLNGHRAVLFCNILGKMLENPKVLPKFVPNADLSYAEFVTFLIKWWILRVYVCINMRLRIKTCQVACHIIWEEFWEKILGSLALLISYYYSYFFCLKYVFLIYSASKLNCLTAWSVEPYLSHIS